MAVKEAVLVRADEPRAERRATETDRSVAGDPAAAPERLAAANTFAVSRTVRRREDQLRIRFEFHNLRVITGIIGPPLLERASAGEAYIVVILPPQHVVERSFLPTETTAWPVATRVAGPSQLAFTLPADVQSIPFTLKSLLQWTKLAASLAPGALPRGAQPTPPPPLQAPQPLHTAIELPWRLLLSPHAGAGWAHATAPVTRNGRTEVWHTRLGVRRADGTVDERDAAGRTMRAIWGTDPDFAGWLLPPGTAGAKTPADGASTPAPGLPFRMPLTPKNRLEIVRASSDFGIAGYLPDPVDVERLMLTSQGGWVDLRGAWQPPPTVLSIREWRHRTAAGRDQNVRVVQQGYLLPFGHRAAVVSVAERAVAAGPNGIPVAYLRQQQYLVVRQPAKSFPAFAQAAAGRRFPFRRVTVTTTTTPALDAPENFAGQAGTFVPKVNKVPFEFHLVAEDSTGRRSDLSAPMVFLDSTVAFDEAKMTPVRNGYNTLPSTDPLRRRAMAGQSFALADSAVAGDTEVEAATVTFAVEAPTAASATAFPANDQPRFHPVLSSAAVRLRHAEQLAGKQFGTVDVTIDPTYAADGFDVGKNPGQVYARLGTPIGFGLGSDRTGPMTMAMDIAGLSRTLGAVGGDLNTLTTGTLDTAGILAGASADTPKLLGGMRLADMVRPASVAGGAVPEDAIRLTSSRGGGGPTAAALAGGATSAAEVYRMKWTPKLYDDLLDGVLAFFPYTYTQIDLEYLVDTETRVPQVKFRVLISSEKPWPPTADLPDSTDPGPLMKNKPSLTLRLFGWNGFMEIDFLKFAFTAETGKDIDVNPKLGEIRFYHAMKFLQKLSDLLTPSTSKRPSPGVIIKPSTTSLEIGFKINMPTFTVGAFGLKNLYVGFSVFIPFDSSPTRIQFRLSERENPFLLSIYWFGGGGFLLIGLGLDGVEWFEIALEFGVHAEVNIGGVIGGAAEIMAGIYFEAKQAPGNAELECVLTGYLRMRGMLQILGIVTITLTVYLGLTYQSAGNKVTGQATITLEVQVWFFSLTVGAHVERKFSGDDNDPSFLDLMPVPDLWDDYVSAFAAIGG